MVCVRKTKKRKEHFRDKISSYERPAPGIYSHSFLRNFQIVLTTVRLSAVMYLLLITQKSFCSVICMIVFFFFLNNIHRSDCYGRSVPGDIKNPRPYSIHLLFAVSSRSIHAYVTRIRFRITA